MSPDEASERLVMRARTELRLPRHTVDLTADYCEAAE